MPGREEFWNIGYPLLGALVYLMLLVAAVSIGYGLYQRYRIWRLGKPMPDLGPWWPRIKRTLKLASLDIFMHRRFVKREWYAGLMHFFLFWGITFLFIATIISALESNFHKYLPFDFPTARFRVQEDFVWDIFGGLFASIGVAMAMVRRYILRPPRLNTFLDDTVVLLSIAGLLLTGFLVEGLRIAGTSPSPAWAAPVGYLFSLMFEGADQGFIEVTHETLYWIHVGILAGAFVYFALRFSKISHIFLSPLNVFLRSDRPLGALRPMGDIETLERFGAGDVNDFTWKQILDFDACTNCGRCQDACPAYVSGKTLSPRKIIQDLRTYATERAPALLSVKSGEQPPPPETEMIPFVSETAVWDCVTCRACMEACPVFIEHIDSIVDMRRYMVMEQSEMPETAQGVLVNLEQRGHPWRGTQATRTDWMEGTSVKTLAEDADVELLLWVGCTAALNEANQRVPRAVAALLTAAGIKSGVLGMEEGCSGDPARRLGNEYLFQMLAQQNIETFNRYGFKKIVTLCPHCFNTIKNEYPQLGGSYEVHHYTELLDELIRQGRLKPSKRVDMVMAYHDSCYLGRHNQVYDAPRRVARAIPGLTLVEMDRRREHSFCCGAGGGHMWMEDSGGERINFLRTDQFLQTGGDTLCVSCPFCFQMFDEGIRTREAQDTRQARDLAEVVAESVGVDGEELA